MDFNNFFTILPAFSRQEQKCKKKIQKKNKKKKKKNFLKKKNFNKKNDFFFTFSAAPRKFRTTDKKIIKIHQLEQIFE